MFTIDNKNSALSIADASCVLKIVYFIKKELGSKTDVSAQIDLTTNRWAFLILINGCWKKVEMNFICDDPTDLENLYNMLIIEKLTNE